MIKIAKYSFGVGDRFGHQARAQLRAMKSIKEAGVTVIPVWNKSFREHSLIGTKPGDTRAAAVAAVEAERWTDGYFLDADHINLNNVAGFLDSCDFFTLDVAEQIGKEVDGKEIESFVERQSALIGKHKLPGGLEIELDREAIVAVAKRYLAAIQAAGNLYRHIVAEKGSVPFVTEVSMDETVAPQTPNELLVILAGLAEEKVPLQTIAPKFTGEFHKGVDYIGDPQKFAAEFDADVSVVKYAIERFKLPESLKLSVHSGSDKFSIYPFIKASLRKYDAGVHVKTAGTSWLEEIIGLAAAGGAGLELAKRIYRFALPHFDALCAPYATVVSIERDKLPTADEVDGWSSADFVNALEHEQSNPKFHSEFRQFVHVSFKIAAELGSEYTDALKAHEETISKYVANNLFERHLKPLFID